MADLARIFGYVFQSPSQMLFARTVREELLFGPRNLGRDDGDLGRVIVRQSCAAPRSTDSTESWIGRRMTLSFGQQKRLALAIALALEP